MNAADKKLCRRLIKAQIVQNDMSPLNDNVRVCHGYGTLDRVNGDRYEGYFCNHKFNGRGKLTFAEDKLGRVHYIGIFEDGLFHGHGTILLPNGDQYKAKFHYNQIRGYGKTTCSLNYLQLQEFTSLLTASEPV